MESEVKKSLWFQFGAAIDMLENAINACPQELWVGKSEFWYKAYHTIFFLDYYLSEPENFHPPKPFTLSEFDEMGRRPERIYSKEELIVYLNYSRDKCFKKIQTFNPESNEMRFKNSYRDYSIFEILIYNLRHIQHHVAQLNLLLRQGNYSVPEWVSRTEKTG